ncbi:MAG: von Willebrand factor type A domain-containing protein [Gemmatimonadaceae bacterium]|nr:von Willebrand factor type A domain-containing protein [Gemmatimonadaceae bacterium]
MSRDNFELPDPAAFGVSDHVLRPTFDGAGHVDEGTIHAWLDGAFGSDDAARVDAHVASCATCQTQVAEARGLFAASARILGTLDGVPAGVVPKVDAAVTAARLATAVPTPRVARRPWIGIAAAAVLMVGSVTVWQRSGTRRGATTASEAPAPAPAASVAEVAGGARDTTVATVATSAQAPSPSASARRAPVAEHSSSRVADAAAPVPSAPESAPAPTVASAVASGVAPTTLASKVESPEASATARWFVMYGTVRDGATLQPVRSGSVQVSGTMYGSTVDSLGRFRIALAVSREVRLPVFARAIGYEPSSTTVAVTGDSSRVDFTLRARPASLAQTVVTASRSRPERALDAPAQISTLTSERIAQRPGNGAPAPAAAPANVGIAGGIARGRELAPQARKTTGMDSLGRFTPPRDREQYDRIEDNPFLAVRSNPMSTFSVDVDRASYGNVRRFITSGGRPPKDAVRIEELINYFPYDLPEPTGADPVRITTDVMPAPWQPRHQLVRIALQSKRIATDKLPPNNLVFLIDVSGSMMSPDKLPLVKQSLRLLVDQLRPQDRVAIVAYAGAAGLVLPSTSGDEKVQITEAIDRLEAGGSTAGGAGIMLAYATARANFLEHGNNRVIIATDGDFNVGATGGDLERLIELKRSEGVYLTVLGFGTGNYQDAMMEKLAKKGNGNYAYIDELNEARKMLMREMGATLLTVANDVKLQIEFNPAAVQGYRLIGYEDRLLRDEDFNDDQKDAGDMGAGHQVTALYEVVPVGVDGTVTLRGVDAPRYQAPAPATAGARDELLFVKLRYKKPGNSASQLLQQAVRTNSGRGTTDTRFAAAVAQFGMLLRDSEYKGTSSAAQVLEQARAALGEDEGGYRAAFIELVERWRQISR